MLHEFLKIPKKDKLELNFEITVNDSLPLFAALIVYNLFILYNKELTC